MLNSGCAGGGRQKRTRTHKCHSNASTYEAIEGLYETGPDQASGLSKSALWFSPYNTNRTTESTNSMSTLEPLVATLRTLVAFSQKVHWLNSA